MPPQRLPLGLVSGNRRFNHELTPYQRGIAIGMSFKNAKSSEIQVALDCSRGALRSTLKFADLRNEGQSQTRIGAPKSYTDADERNLLRHIRKNPKDSYAMTQKACGMKCSKSTIKRIFVKHGIHNWRARKRPALTEEQVANRLAWCLEHRHISPEEWGLYMWSDECSVLRIAHEPQARAAAASLMSSSYSSRTSSELADLHAGFNQAPQYTGLATGLVANLHRLWHSQRA